MCLHELEKILSETKQYSEGHHMGLPFLSAYQLAIIFAEQYKNHEIAKTYLVGGTGTGEYQSLSQYIARKLSSAIQNNEISTIEGGFLSHDQLESMVFANNVQVSTINSKSGHAIFRYIGKV